MINYLIDNWFLALVAIAGLVVITHDVRAFFNMDPEKQKAKVQEWLVWAVDRAEKELGEPGQLKLRSVYAMFVSSFPWMVKVLDFEEFAVMVDIALERLKKIEEHVEGEKE